MHEKAGVASSRGGAFRKHRGNPSNRAYVSSVTMEFGQEMSWVVFLATSWPNAPHRKEADVAFRSHRSFVIETDWA